MKIEYETNNSGGSWWIGDEEWLALEKAGWRVIWGGKYFCKSKYSLAQKPEHKPEPCKTNEGCPGHRKCDSLEEVDQHDYRFLGAAAQAAEKEFETPGDAMREFEKITGQDVSDDGCNCCGAPHIFSWDKGDASGGECLEHLGLDSKMTRREALEKLKTEEQ